MTATYDISNNIGKVRLLVGDNDLTDVIFTDEEIQIFLDAQSQEVNLAAADLLEAWAAKYGVSAESEKIGDYAYVQKIVERMLNMADRIRTKQASTPAGAIAEVGQTDFTSRDIVYNRQLRSG